MTKVQIAVVAVAVFIVAWIALQAPSDPPSDPANRRGAGTTQARASQGSAALAAAEAARDAAVERDEARAEELADEAAEAGAASAHSGSVTRVAARRRAAHAAGRQQRRQEHRAPQVEIDSGAASRRLAASRPESPRLLGAGARVLPPTPAPTLVPPPLPDVQATDVLYDSGDDAEFSSDDQIEVDRPGRIEGASGTIAFDLDPEWDELVGDADFVALGSTAKVAKLGNLLQFEVVDAGGVRHVVTAKVDQWELGDSHQIAATWDDKQLYLYVNGQLAGSDGLEHPIQIAPDAALRIGSSYDDGRPIAPATLSRIRLRDELFVPAASAEAAP